MRNRVEALQRYVLFVPLCAALALGLLAQQRGPMPPPGPSKTAPAPNATGKPLRLDVDMVLVPVTVVDPYDRLVTGLEQDNFRVFENNIEQEVIHFDEEDVPISIGVVFDMSGSMSDKIDKSKMAALQFFKTANPQDEFFLVDFSDRAQLVSSFTSDVDVLRDRLMFTRGTGRTALFDAIYLGLSEMRGAHNSRKALLIISDGGENHSRYSERDLREYLKEADVQIYAIGIYEPLADRFRTPEEGEGPALLDELAEMSGGRVFPVQNLNELPDIATKISMELRNQYVLGYRPGNRVKDGKWRKIKITLRPPRGLPPLTDYYKRGYYSPGP
ncbi:MAG TPA: VWA domain-containing protein [Candidatus Acidoferrales bacterium]|nr:VWA domain-containing protein [Candidatus Acidoferrales bacterium]